MVATLLSRFAAIMATNVAVFFAPRLERHLLMCFLLHVDASFSVPAFLTPGLPLTPVVKQLGCRTTAISSRSAALVAPGRGAHHIRWQVSRGPYNSSRAGVPRDRRVYDAVALSTPCGTFASVETYKCSEAYPLTRRRPNPA